MVCRKESKGPNIPLWNWNCSLFLVVKCPGGCYDNTCCDTKTGNCKTHFGSGGDNCAGK